MQGVGNPHLAFDNNTLGVFAQDSWRMKPRLTVNYGLRYDVEFLPQLCAVHGTGRAAYKTFGLTKGVPSSNLNFQPRIGVAYDVFGDGKTVARASYGIFFDHPLMALVFDSVVADGTQAPQILLFGGSPVPVHASPPESSPTLECRQLASPGRLNCLPSAFTYLPNQQRFNPTPNTPSVWINQNYLQPGQPSVPLSVLPFGYPTAANFKYGYSNQVNLGIEHQFGKSWTVDHCTTTSMADATSTGPSTPTPRNGNLIVQNWYNAMTDPNVSQAQKAAFANNPLAVDVAGVNLRSLPSAESGMRRLHSSRAGQLLPSERIQPNAAVLRAAATQRTGAASHVSLRPRHTAINVIPFSDMVANYSNGTSDYNAFTVNVKKRFSEH